MGTTVFSRRFGGLVLALTLAAGCDQEPRSAPPPKKDPAQDPPKAAAKKVEVGKNVFLEVQGDKRRVLVNAYVCLREGQLEQLMCRKRTKEHEAILAADADARQMHLALVAAKAEPGSPVQFSPKFQVARGTRIKVSLQYEDNGKLVTVPAQRWVRNAKTKKDLDVDWVFAGSFLSKNPLDEKAPPYYAANDGDVICVANFGTAMLDLPINSSKNNDDLAFEANKERIPPLNAKVTVILEPVLEKK
jgi:hypothetical protein